MSCSCLHPPPLTAGTGRIPTSVFSGYHFHQHLCSTQHGQAAREAEQGVFAGWMFWEVFAFVAGKCFSCSESGSLPEQIGNLVFKRSVLRLSPRSEARGSLD